MNEVNKVEMNKFQYANKPMTTATGSVIIGAFRRIAAVISGHIVYQICLRKFCPRTEIIYNEPCVDLPEKKNFTN